jgi:predicted PurR-regulated permease PerM
MELKNYNTYFFLIILAVVSFFAFLIFKPFVTAILAAAFMAIVFQRPYNFFLKITRDSRAISSFLTSLFVVLIVIVPLFFMAGLIINEVNIFYQTFLADSESYHRYLSIFTGNLKKMPLLQLADVDKIFSQSEFVGYFKNISQTILGVIQGTYHALAGFVLWIFAMFFALYYFLIDGKRAIKKILRLSPLKDSHEKIIIEKFISIVRATIKGVLILGIIQGTLGGMVFAIAGIQSPVIWGLLMFIFSLVPMIGTALVWFPAGVFMLLMGNVWQGVLILSVGVGIISTIDNVLRPKLIGNDTQIHPLLVFFATLGGLVVFGATGFIIGPVIVAMCLTLWGIYAKEFNDQLNEYNG